MNGAEPWAMLFDRLDRLDRRLEAVDGRVRCVENTCEGIRHDLDAQRSRISRETEAAGEADESLSERVKALELAQAKAGGERKGFSKAAAILALVAAGGTGAGLESIVKALAGV